MINIDQCEVKKCFRFLFNLEGIDSFILESFWFPTVKIENGKKTYSDFSFSVYNPIAPSGSQQIYEWLNGRKKIRSGYLKILDKEGRVAEQWKLEGVKLTEVCFGRLNYNYNDPLKIECRASLKSMKLEF